MDLLIGQFEPQSTQTDLYSTFKTENIHELQEKILKFCQSFSSVKLSHLCEILNLPESQVQLPENLTKIEKPEEDMANHDETKSKENKEKKFRIIDFIFQLILDDKLDARIDQEKGLLIMNCSPNVNKLNESLDVSIAINNVILTENLKSTLN